MDVAEEAVAASLKFGYARVSTDKQDKQSQLDGLARLGVEPQNIYFDEGLSATTRSKRTGLREAMAAARAGDQFVVTALDRMARNARDAHNIAYELEQKSIVLNMNGTLFDPADIMGRMMFSMLAMFAEFEAGIIRQRTREGMAIAKARGRLQGKKPKLNPRQDAHLASMYASGEHTVGELQELYGGISRSSVYRALERHKIRTAADNRNETSP